ncbi:MAG TPA: hypothetical protein VIO33_15145 [Burkholderiaceae bacterium]
MKVIQIPEEDLAELQAEFSKAGIAFTVGKEERYFGDAHTVSLVIDAAKAVAAIVPPLLAYLQSRKRKKIMIDGVEITVSQPLTDADKEALRRALNQ